MGIALLGRTREEVLANLKKYPLALISARPYGGYVGVPFTVNDRTMKITHLSAPLLSRFRIIPGASALVRNGEEDGAFCSICSLRLSCAAAVHSISGRLQTYQRGLVDCGFKTKQSKNGRVLATEEQPQVFDYANIKTIRDLAILLQTKADTLSWAYVSLSAERATDAMMFVNATELADKKVCTYMDESKESAIINLPKRSDPRQQIKLGETFDEGTNRFGAPYRRLQIKKKKGGIRELYEPNITLKALQKNILHRILNKFELPEYVTAFTPNSNIVKNAQFHVNKDVVTCIDLANFFPSVGAGKVHNSYLRMGFTPYIAHVLTTLTTYENKLVQGPPTSPALANISFLPTDAAIKKVSDAYRFNYSRYADDLVFSGDRRSKHNVSKMLEIASKIVVSHGFTVNDKKTKIYYRPGVRLVTGLVVNEKVALRKAWLNRIDSIVFQLRAGKAVPEPFSVVLGKIAFVTMVEPEYGKPIKDFVMSLKGLPLFGKEPKFEVDSEAKWPPIQ